jgi:hypothetical protein
MEFLLPTGFLMPRMRRYGAGSLGHPAGDTIRIRATVVSEEHRHGLYHH